MHNFKWETYSLLMLKGKQIAVGYRVINYFQTLLSIQQSFYYSLNVYM